MSYHLLGLYYENAFLLMSVFSCWKYIYELYLNSAMHEHHEVLAALHVVELVLASLFTFDWLLSFFMADHKLIFCTRYACE